MSEPEADVPVTLTADNLETQQLGTMSIHGCHFVVSASGRPGGAMATLATGTSGVASSAVGTSLGSAGSVPTSGSGEYS